MMRDMRFSDQGGQNHFETTVPAKNFCSGHVAWSGILLNPTASFTKFQY